MHEILPVPLFRGGTWIFLFVWGFSSHSRIFHSCGDVTITGEGLQILIYARHSRPLSSEGSLPCHTYYDTGHPFIMVISEDPWHSHLMPSVWRCSELSLHVKFLVRIASPTARKSDTFVDNIENKLKLDM